MRNFFLLILLGLLVVVAYKAIPPPSTTTSTTDATTSTDNGICAAIQTAQYKGANAVLCPDGSVEITDPTGTVVASTTDDVTTATIGGKCLRARVVSGKLIFGPC